MPSTMPTIRGGPSREAAELYASDAYSWAMQQADALRRRDLDAIDWDNVIEEIESVGHRERTSWESPCAQALKHLLAIEHWSEASKDALRHWAREITLFRQQMADMLDRNPGLTGQYAPMYASAWRIGRRAAIRRLTEYEDPAMSKATQHEWDRIRLPRECPYDRMQVAAYDPERDWVPDTEIWPPAVAHVLNRQLGRSYPILPEGPDS